MARARLRDLGLSIGQLPPGPHNAITDVPGVLVGHSTIVHDEPRIARTGVTVVLARQDIWHNHAFAGACSFNGCGEMTGVHWIEEAGLLQSAIAITNTFSVGTVHEALAAYEAEQADSPFSLPVVAETYDGWLNDARAFHVTREHVFAALAAARSGPVEEGNVGGGTGMICHEFKGGIGTASRVVATGSGSFTLGALVQANYGTRSQLRVDGVPVGQELDTTRIPSAYSQPREAGSIIVLLATDAPLLALQCKRLARRAAIGLGRAGGVGHNGSGDLVLAFATGNQLPANPSSPYELRMLPHEQLNPLFNAAAEAVEEAIVNALTAAETLSGLQGRTAQALPLDELQRVMAAYGRGGAGRTGPR